MNKTDQTSATQKRIEASAFRYSNEPRAVGTFLQALGLSPIIWNEKGTWIELQSMSGRVSVHAAGEASTDNARPGTTDLVMVVPDARAFAREFEASAQENAAQDGSVGRNRDVTVDVWDESFGRQASIRLGDSTLFINEEQTDAYGYHRQQPEPGPVTVVTHLYSRDVHNETALLALLGFEAVAAPAASSVEPDGTTRLEASTPSAGGVIVLHESEPDAPAACAMAFETAESLGIVADRLRAAGFAPSRAGADGTRLEVVDPDGQPVTIEQSQGKLDV